MGGITWKSSGPNEGGLLKSECGQYTVAPELVMGKAHYTAYVTIDRAATMVAMTPRPQEAQHFLELHQKGILKLDEGPLPLDFREAPPYPGLKTRTTEIYPSLKAQWAERIQAAKAAPPPEPLTRSPQMSLG